MCPGGGGVGWGSIVGTYIQYFQNMILKMSFNFTIFINTVLKDFFFILATLIEHEHYWIFYAMYLNKM